MTDEVVSLREYVETLIRALEKATDVAREEMNRRLEGMNKFREELDRQTATFVTREVLDVVVAKWDADLCAFKDAIRLEIKPLTTFKNKDEGKEEQKSDNRALIWALLAFLMGISSLIIAIVK